MTPWLDPDAQRDAVTIACNVRDDDAHQIQALYLWDTDRLVNALVTAAAMIDINLTVSQLLNWHRPPADECAQGHAYVGHNRMTDRQGQRRCRTCYNAWRAADRARKRAG